MLNNLIRKFLTYLSFPDIYSNEALDKKKLILQLNLREKALRIKSRKKIN